MNDNLKPVVCPNCCKEHLPLGKSESDHYCSLNCEREAWGEDDCKYCGGDCERNYKKDNTWSHLCDGFAGDIDGLYADEDKEGKTQ